MRCHCLACALVLGLAGALWSGEPKEARQWVPAIQEKIQHELDSLEALYKHLHTHPELSYEEEKTAERMAKELKALGFEVTQNVGGHGVVGVLKNGDGPTVPVLAAVLRKGYRMADRVLRPAMVTVVDRPDDGTTGEPSAQ